MQPGTVWRISILPFWLEIVLNNIMSLGLCGAHRTGKTTLAELLSIKINKNFVRTTTSEIFRQFGLNPSQPINFEDRLQIQKQILISYEKTWSLLDRDFVSDRTPIDLMAYTLADIQGSTDVDFLELNKYIESCFEATNKYFKLLIVIQPGIDLVPADGKAALNKAYIEHLNSLIIGLCHDERLNSEIACIKRENIFLQSRLDKTLEIIDKYELFQSNSLS